MLFVLAALVLQLQTLPLTFLPVLILDDCMMGYIAVVLVRAGIYLLIICYLACIQLSVYFSLLRQLMVRQMRQSKRGVLVQWTFRLYDVEYNKTLELLLKIDKELFKHVAMVLVVMHMPTLIVHSNLLYFEPKMNMAVMIYILIVMTIQMTIALVSMVLIIPTSEAAYVMSSTLPSLQLRLKPQAGLTKMKLKVMRYFESMNCPAAERATISVGNIDQIRRYSIMQFLLILSNFFIMIARLLIEERQNWIYE